MNGSSCSSPLDPTAEKNGKNIAYSLVFVVSLVGNSFIGIIVYKAQTLRKPINFFIVNKAMSDLLVPIFLFPSELTKLYVDSWLISGPLGQTLCKLVFFLGFISIQVSIQSLVLIAVDRFGADGISPPFSTHQFKAVPLLHSRHMDRRYGSHVAIFVRLQTY